ncbi:uncharacterized protein DFL_003124 [Arthrobotrys flagrans]|uniref:PD-(D/E)XK nuclease-like domain-containing protein n=1 Tax=Arthrobotrys flagrans TaxID=97331 RepID=A0A437ACX6_ARTFL|nr:hypothetical protein DFL_003124 [Arthrobotrys flagrans]
MDNIGRIEAWLNSILADERPAKRQRFDHYDRNPVVSTTFRLPTLPPSTSFSRNSSMERTIVASRIETLDDPPKAKDKRTLDQYVNSHNADSPTPGSLSSASQTSGTGDYSTGSKKAKANKTAGLKANPVNLGRTVECPVYFANITSPPEDILLPPNVADIIKGFSELAFDANFIPLSAKDHLQGGDTVAPLEKVLAFEIDAKVPDDPFISPPHPHFIITNTQSKHIHRHLFPDIPARHQSKTVDYTLQFNHKNSKYQTFYTEYKTRSLQALSPFKDASVEYIIPVLMVEVKPPGGDYLEAQYQAALATIATVNHRRGVISQSRSSLLGSAQVDTLDLPTPFFTVVGHQ